LKQVTQRLKDGEIEVLEVPPPALTAEGVIIDVRASLLSAGTERGKVETGRKSLLGKARSRPDQVRAVIDKARRDGVRATAGAVRARLDEPSTLGYSAAGVVTDVGTRVRGLAPGDRVACAGGTAVHAELVQVPGNLCVRLPGEVGFTEGAFTTVGSIALHAVRQADVRLGERVAVIGLGLIGQLAAQLLKAAGCRVVGIDLSEELVALARRLEAVDYGATREAFDQGRPPPEACECDAVLVTAATRSDDPIELAAELCRDRGRVVVVGDVGLTLPRAPYYDKEIELRLSRSYGPGRYDREYEERGLDYPIGYVRWTERRNMEVFVGLVAEGKVDVTSLVTNRVSIDEAPAAYERLLAVDGSPLGIVLEYSPTPGVRARAARGTSDEREAGGPSGSPAVAGVIGAGSFAQRILIPALAQAGFELAGVASAGGVSAKSAADRFRFKSSATADEIIADPGIGLVVVATRHSSHAALASAALRAGKAVFVEKPPCLTLSELQELRAAWWESGQPLVVGFNRRHAPLARALRDHVAGHGPLHLIYRVSPDPLPPDHWLLEPDTGGGPLIGEGCHFVDLACWIAGSLPDRVACTVPAASNAPLAASERFTVTLEFGDGSLATISYGPSGSTAVEKEYLEVHCGDRSAVLNDFRRLTLYSGRRKEVKRGRRQDKGHAAQFAHLRSALGGGRDPGDGHDPLDTMQVTLAALASTHAGRALDPLQVAAGTDRAPGSEPAA
jgi:predicted dehydrogenase/threonine dehydrogenase-like Zn-dependent dehydrogenase